MISSRLRGWVHPQVTQRWEGLVPLPFTETSGMLWQRVHAEIRLSRAARSSAPERMIHGGRGAEGRVKPCAPLSGLGSVAGLTAWLPASGRIATSIGQRGFCGSSFSCTVVQEVSRRVTTIRRREGESFDQLLRRFRKSVTTSGVLGTLRRKRYHISKGELERIKKRKGIQRARRKERRKTSRSTSRSPGGSSSGSSSG